MTPRNILYSILACILLLLSSNFIYAEEEQPKEQLPNNLGVTREYEDGFINVRIENNTLKVFFLDKDKNIVEPPFPEAVARYEYEIDPRGSKSFKPTYNVVLKQAGQALIAERVIRPPHNIFIYITLREPKEKPTTTSRYKSPYSATKKVKKEKTKSLPRIHINELPPLKESKVKTSSASNGKKYRFNRA